MRGCLSVIVLAAAFAAAALWFGGPTAAAFLVDGALTTAGFQAAERHVAVEADPPLELATGKADAVRLRATDAEFPAGVTADELDLALGGVDVLDRDFETVTGRLEGAAVEAVGGGAIGPMTVDVDGPADAAEVTAHLPAASFLPLVRGALANAIGASPGDVRLTAPDRVTFSVGGVGANGRILVDDGALALRVSVPGADPETLTIFDPPAALEVRDARVDEDGLTLEGQLDVEDLIGL